MIHNPATMAYGDKAEMEKTIGMLSEVKESIINAYEIKSGLARTKIAHMMDDETWLNARKAVELALPMKSCSTRTGKNQNHLPCCTARSR